MSHSQQWVGPQKAVNAEDQRLRGRQAIALTSVLVEIEVLRQACLQTLTKSNGALRKLLFVDNCYAFSHGSPLAVDPDAGEANWLEHEINQICGRNMLHGMQTGRRHGVAWVQERQRLFRMP